MHPNALNEKMIAAIKDKTGLDRRSLLKLSAASLATSLIASPANLALANAPFLGSAKPSFYRFKLGEFEITTISDGEAQIDKVFPIFGSNGKEEEVIKLLEANFVPPKLFNPGFTPTIINTGEKLIMFDTGNGDNGFAKRPYAGKMLSLLETAGFKPEQIDIIVITHGHPDHVGGMKEAGKEVFTNATYVISEIEFDFWNNKDKLPKGLEGFGTAFEAATAGLKEKFRTIKPGDDVVTGVKAIKSYGHTPGHLSFHIESKGAELLVMGDVAHHHVASFARPDWYMFFDTDKDQGVETRKTIYDMCATKKLPVIGFHMPFPSLGYIEVRKDTGYRWVQHTYQLK